MMTVITISVIIIITIIIVNDQRCRAFLWLSSLPPTLQTLLSVAVVARLVSFNVIIVIIIIIFVIIVK